MVLYRVLGFGLATALSVVPSTVFSAVDVQCPVAKAAGADLAVTVVYSPEPGDPPAVGAAVYMVANISEQLGSVTMFGPWARSFPCDIGPCSKVLLVDTIPVDAQAKSMFVAGVAVLDAANNTIGDASCLVRVIAAQP